MKKSDKFTLIVGGFLDKLTILLLAIIQIYYLWQHDMKMFLLATCAHGIWCISSVVAEFKFKQKESDNAE